MNWFKSSTLAGLAGVVLSLGASPDFLGLLNEKQSKAVTTICGVIAAFGIRRRLPAP